MKQLIIIIVGLLASASLWSQDLVRIWESRPGERLNYEKIEWTLKAGSSSVSDYNKDGISDIVLQRRGSSTIYIIDGKTRMPADSLEIETTASLCNNEVIEGFHVSFVDIDPNKTTNRTAVINRRINGRLLGTRSDNRVVISGGSTMLTMPCEYELKGFLDRDGDGYYIITMENIMAGTIEIWALP
jgi:hypothetical protein